MNLSFSEILISKFPGNNKFMNTAGDVPAIPNPHQVLLEIPLHQLDHLPPSTFPSQHISLVNSYFPIGLLGSVCHRGVQLPLKAPPSAPPCARVAELLT